jgi:hypothetical protein
MTTLEITISDDSQLEHFISMLKEFRFVSDVQLGTKAEQKKKKTKINWTDAKLDAASDALVRDSIARRKAGDRSHIADNQSVKTVFYDLQD